MPSSKNNLWTDLISWPNLLRAYRNCRKRKRFKTNACRFDFNWEGELHTTRSALMDGTYEPGEYRNFFIYEPKTRKISAAPFRDRVVHHAIVQMLEPLWEPKFIFDSYACRVKKGTHAAIHRVQKLLRKFSYFIKSDVVKFFPCIDHSNLNKRISRFVRCRPTLDLIGKIIDSGKDVLADESPLQYFPGDNLFSILRPKGLPIGNLTSQFFANVFLDQIDHFIKETLRIPGYVRYADDFIFFGNNKQALRDQLSAIEDRLVDLRLKLHANKTVLSKCETGVKFLGFRVTRDSLRLTSNGISRFTRRLRQLKWKYRHRFNSADQVGRSINAWRNHVRFGNSFGIEKAIQNRIVFNRP